jgi:PAS domain S-box-containing protein
MRRAASARFGLQPASQNYTPRVPTMNDPGAFKAGHPPAVDSRLFQLAIDQALDYAVFLLDRNGYILTWNRGARRLKGYEAQEIIGRHFSTFYTRESLDTGWPAHELKVAALEGRFEDEGWRVRKDGSRFWANVVITALREGSGQLLGFSKITRDVTDRKLHEEALARSEERFRLLVEGVTDYAIYMLDTDGLVSSWNAGAQRSLGYTPAEIIGRHYSRFFTAEDVQAGRPWEELAQARRTGRSEVEGWRVRKNGEHFWARAIVTALHDGEGRLRGFAKVTQDLTAHRHIQDLERAAKNVSEFIAILAHELRNPLAPIRTAMQVIAHTGPTHPARDALYKTIDRQSAQLVRIVDDMLDISRVTRGEFSIECAPVNLNDIARNAGETAAPFIETAAHKLQMQLTPEVVTVYGDAHRLAQLVTNLLTNAARYTPRGGTITVRTRTEQDWAYLSVRDTGRGIDAAWLERIFDMFFHGRPALERTGGGLGIGLAIARRIAELHGGSLHAVSEGRDKGSEFILRIPVMTPDVVKPREEPPEPGLGVAQQPRRILVVDDNADAAGTMEILLQSLGHRARVVHDGVAALRAAEDFRPHVVLLDIGLPGMDGYEVARRLRALKSDPAFRLVAVTGWGQQEDRQKSEEAGFDLHLVKPIDASDLTRAVSDAPMTIPSRSSPTSG